MCHSANTLGELNPIRKLRTHGGEHYAQIRFAGYSNRGASENPLNFKIQETVSICSVIRSRSR